MVALIFPCAVAAAVLPLRLLSAHVVAKVKPVRSNISLAATVTRSGISQLANDGEFIAALFARITARSRAYKLPGQDADLLSSCNELAFGIAFITI